MGGFLERDRMGISSSWSWSHRNIKLIRDPFGNWSHRYLDLKCDAMGYWCHWHLHPMDCMILALMETDLTDVSTIKHDAFGNCCHVHLDCIYDTFGNSSLGISILYIFLIETVELLSMAFHPKKFYQSHLTPYMMFVEKDLLSISTPYIILWESIS